MNLNQILNEAVEKYNRPSFIEDDPISIPHSYTQLQDIEVTAFWTSMLAWGQRKTIINKSKELFGLMDNAPYDFLMNHQETDLKPFENFKHRTFQPTDTLFFIHSLSEYYKQHDSLETAFAEWLDDEDTTTENALIGFHDRFFDFAEAPQRTRKHVATPKRKSTCKKLNMFLRWMVRKDDKGVDFGLWNNIGTHRLLIPLDVHVRRVAHRLGLLSRTQNDFKAVLALTEALREFDPDDPVKYDFALFGIGVMEKHEMM